jgi:hypothetical protein
VTDHRADAWNVRRVKGDDAKTWMFQPAAYYRATRSDGLPIWMFLYAVGKPKPTEDEAQREGISAFGSVPRDPMIGHGKLALRLGDLLAPDEESEYRLGGEELYKLFYEQTRGGRYKLALGKRGPEETTEVVRTGSGYPKGGAGRQKVSTITWVLVRRLGIVSDKQLEQVHRVGLGVARAIKIPRDAGRVIK